MQRQSISSTSSDFAVDLQNLDTKKSDDHMLDSLLSNEFSLPVPTTSTPSFSTNIPIPESSSTTLDLDFISGKPTKSNSSGQAIKSPKNSVSSDLRLKLEKQISHAKKANSALQVEPKTNAHTNANFVKDMTTSQPSVACMNVLSLNGTDQEENLISTSPTPDVGNELDDWISQDCKGYPTENECLLPKDSECTQQVKSISPDRSHLVIKESAEFVSCVIPNSPKHSRRKNRGGKCKSAATANNSAAPIKSYSICVDSPAVIEATSTTTGCDVKKTLIPPQRMAIPNKFPNCNNTGITGNDAEKKPLVQWDSSDDR